MNETKTDNPLLEWKSGLFVACLAVFAFLLWQYWGRTLQLAVALAAAGAGIMMLRYHILAPAIAGFILISNLGSFIPGSTSFYFAGVFLLLAVRKFIVRDISWRLNGYFIAVLLFIAWFQITGLWVDQTSFYNWSLVLRVVIVVFVLSELMKSTEFYFSFFVGGAIGMIFSSISTIQTAGEFYMSGVADQIAGSVGYIESSRFYGHWPDPNTMSMTITAYLGGIIALWRSKMHFTVRMLMAAATVTGIVAILISQSRTGLIGCAIVAVIMLAVEQRKFALSAVFAGVVTVLLLVAPVDLFGRFLSMFQGGDNSSSDRLNLVLSGWKLFWNSPIFGGGMGSYENNVLFLMPHLPHGFFAHNTYVDIAVDGGIVAAGLYITCVVLAIAGLSWRDWKIDQTDKGALINAGLRAGLVSTVFSASTMSTTTYIPFWALFTMCAMFGVTRKNTAKNNPALTA